MKTFIDKHINKLLSANITNANNEIIWFLNQQFGIQIENIKLNNFSLDTIQRKEFEEFIKRRMTSEPFQYIINEAPFHSLSLYVNKHVLIPRPETETIIDILKTQNVKVNSFLDIGTGSGNIVLAVMYNKIAKQALAIDISDKALEVAKINTKRYNIDNIKFLKCDYLEKNLEQSFDLIVSNPPYISKKEFFELSDSVKNFEPKLALTDFFDGLTFYRKMAGDINHILNKNGILLMEIGLVEHKDEIEKIFKNYNLIWHKDLNHDYRFLQIIK